MIVIIDYDMGNVGSVKNALRFLGAEVMVSRAPEDIKKAMHIILPGVGAFGDGIKKLNEFNLPNILQEEVLDKKKPFLGICLGMQMLAESGEEGGIHKGLGWIKGNTRRFRINEDKFRLPHVGWNDVISQGRATLFREITTPTFYFVHSYFLEPSEENVVAAVCDYGETFSAAIEKDNIFGVQFHPEKSQKDGLALLRNFLTL